MVYFYDTVRYLDFAMFGFGCAFMLITNILAFKILRPPKKFGFLWWHITTISLSFFLLGIVTIHIAFLRLGEEEPNWRTPLIFFGFLFFMVSQIMICLVEIQRYVAHIAIKEANAKGIAIKEAIVKER